MKVSTGCIISRGSEEEPFFFPFPYSKGCLYSVAPALLPLSKLAMTNHISHDAMSLVLSLLPPFSLFWDHRDYLLTLGSPRLIQDNLILKSADWQH